MTAFEIYLNGRKKCTVGINEAGLVVSAITWTGYGKGYEEDLEFRVSGVVSKSMTHLDWLSRKLKRGDEVKIIVTGKKTVDRPKKKRPGITKSRKKRESDDIERYAAEFGFTIDQ